MARCEENGQAFHWFPTSGKPQRRIYKTGDLACISEEGLVYFVGRADSQIKSRGYRIELGEIEAAANTLPDLKECAIVAIPTEGFEGMLICCAYVTTTGSEVTAASYAKETERICCRATCFQANGRSSSTYPKTLMARSTGRGCAITS